MYLDLSYDNGVSINDMSRSFEQHREGEVKWCRVIDAISACQMILVIVTARALRLLTWSTLRLGTALLNRPSSTFFVIMTPAIRAIDENNCNSKNEE